MIRHRLLSPGMTLFWIGVTFGVNLIWLRDNLGPGWAMLIGVPAAAAVDRWINGPINTDGDVSPPDRST